jgi:hypothetical protein
VAAGARVVVVVVPLLLVVVVVVVVVATGKASPTKVELGPRAHRDGFSGKCVA